MGLHETSASTISAHCRLGVCSHCESQALLWHTWKVFGQQAGLAGLLDSCKSNPGQQYLTIAREMDEASMFVSFSEEMVAKWISYQMVALGKDIHMLCESDANRISKALASKRDGVAIICVQSGSILATGGGTTFSAPLVFRPVIVQNVRGNTIQSAVNSGSPMLSSDDILGKWFPFICALFLVFPMDRASGNARFFRCLQILFSSYPQVLLMELWCLAHGVALCTTEIMKDEKVLGPLFAWMKLIRQLSHYLQYIGHMPSVLVHQVEVLPSPAWITHAVAQQRAESNAF